MRFDTNLILMLPMVVFILFMCKDGILKLLTNLYSLAMRLFYHFIEKDIAYIFKETNIKFSIDTFQVIRVISSFLLSLMMLIVEQRLTVMVVLSGVLMYKGLYLYLYFRLRARKKMIKQQLPYLLKTIIYFCYIYPVSNALEHAIDLVPKIYKEALSNLVKMIDDDPTIFKPYYVFYERLYKPSDNFLMYMRVINRIAQSGGGNHHELLASIDNNVSNELNIVRKSKNRAINDTIQYLGLLPVLMVTLMLGYLLVIVSQTI